jgi:hypothetical protein
MTKQEIIKMIHAGFESVESDTVYNPMDRIATA